MKAKTQRQRARRAALVRKAITASLTASILLFLAVFFAFVPFRLLLPAYAISQREQNELRLHFLGLTGGVTIVEFPDGEALVIDAGNGSFESDNTLCRYLRGLDVKSLSVIATNSDPVHVGGMPALFETFDVEKVYLPAVGSESGVWQRFLSAVEREGCKREPLSRYGRIENGSGAYLVCISPYSEEGEEVNKEDASALLYLSYAGANALISGDITARREKLLLSEYALSDRIFDSGNCRVVLDEIDLFLAPSHGSNEGCSAEWLGLLNPKASVICCNRKEMPSSAALARICAYSGYVYRTDELGTVMATLSGNGCEFRTHMIK